MNSRLILVYAFTFLLLAINLGFAQDSYEASLAGAREAIIYQGPG